jgi:hypothetical protein
MAGSTTARWLQFSPGAWGRRVSVASAKQCTAPRPRWAPPSAPMSNRWALRSGSVRSGYRSTVARGPKMARSRTRDRRDARVNSGRGDEIEAAELNVLPREQRAVHAGITGVQPGAGSKESPEAEIEAPHRAADVVRGAPLISGLRRADAVREAPRDEEGQQVRARLLGATQPLTDLESGAEPIGGSGVAPCVSGNGEGSPRCRMPPRRAERRRAPTAEFLSHPGRCHGSGGVARTLQR